VGASLASSNPWDRDRQGPEPDATGSYEDGAQGREAKRQTGKIRTGRMTHWAPERKPRCGTNPSFDRADSHATSSYPSRSARSGNGR